MAVINEFVFNHAGTDTAEFIEVYRAPGSAALPPGGLTLLVIEGDAAEAGVIDRAYPVGPFSAEGFWTTGFLANELENGTQTALLVGGFTGRPGQDLDTGNDGLLDLMPWATLLDSVAVSDGGASDRTYGAVVLTADNIGEGFTPGGASRIPDGADADSIADWRLNDFEGAGLPGFAGNVTGNEVPSTPGTANGAIAAPPPPPGLAKIGTIQGAGHRSPLEGTAVVTAGIVTARSNNGFWMQDPQPDADIATSEGIFVFTGSTPAVRVGDAVEVAGTVTEFTRTTASPGHLSITQLTGPTVTVLSSGNALPDAVVIGTDRLPPTEITDLDRFTGFNPVRDGVDFWESLEGMRVMLPDAMAVGPSFNSTGTAVVNANKAEVFAVADRGAQATGLNAAGGLTLAPGDSNPERVAVQANQQVLAGVDFVAKVGDLLGDVVGVLDYDSRGNFEIVLTEAITVADGGLVKEDGTIPPGDLLHLTVGTYNVENLSGVSPAAKFAGLAGDIVLRLKAPDIIALQEIQDNNGATNDGTVDASLTYQRLIDAIVAAGGPEYRFLNVDPLDGTSGGQPGGNIRVGFLYNDDRVDVVGGSLRQVDPANAPAWTDSRIPLAADFVFNGEIITVVNNHWASKGGSSPQFGTIQPLLNGGLGQRIDQALAVKAFVDDILALDPLARLVVMGDLNEFPWETPLEIVTGRSAGQEVLFDLYQLSQPDAAERYEYVFDGNHQILDHLMASWALVTGGFEFQSLQVNSQFPAASRNSDHDPAVARFFVPADAAIELAFWRDALFPGAPQPGQWRDPSLGVLYRAAGDAEQASIAPDDSATGANALRFTAGAGDVAISRVDYASGQQFGAAGGPAVASLAWTSPQAAELSVTGAWNSIKSVAIADFTGDHLRIGNVVDVLADFSDRTRDLTLLVDGAKRGSLATGAGNDTIGAFFFSNETRWSNTIVIDAGAGDDVVTVGQASPGFVPSFRWSLRDSAAIVTGGAGDDRLIGSASHDTAVFGGRLADYAIAVDAAGVTTVMDLNAADGDDGTDVITGFDALRFADATLGFAGGVWA